MRKTRRELSRERGSSGGVPAGPLGVINFSKDLIFWDVAIFSNSSELILTDRIYRCYYRLLCFFSLVRGGDLQDLSSMRGFRGILSICTIIALIHPSRCLREKREKKGCENRRSLCRRDFVVLTFYNFLFRALKKKSTYTKGSWIYTYTHTYT